MVTVITPDPGKPHVEIPAVQVPIDQGHDVCLPENQAGCVHGVPNPLQFFKVIFNTLIVCGCLGIVGLVNIKIMCRCMGHGGTGNGDGNYCEYPEGDQKSNAK